MKEEIAYLTVEKFSKIMNNHTFARGDINNALLSECLTASKEIEFQLQTQLSKSEAIIKEAREYISKELEIIGKHQYAIGTRRLTKLLAILDKGSDIDEKIRKIYWII